jgi:neural Wiskott-Aldrich syndrome protein
VLQRILQAPNTRVSHLGGSEPALRRGAAISATMHLAVLLLVFLGLPSAKREEEQQQDVGIAMVFDGTAESSVHAPAPGSVPAPASTPDVTLAPAAQQAARPQPVETPPPPPPPPPPSPPQTTALMLPTPPLPVLPPVPSSAPTVSPPPAAPPTPAQTQQPLPTPPLPVPPPAPTAPPQSTTSQPNPTKNPAPESTALDNTLEKLRSLQHQSQPPRARPNPQSGGAPNGGGNPTGDNTSELTGSQIKVIGEFVRRCWTTDPGMLDLDRMQVVLTVTTDASGVARHAEVAPEDAGKVTSNARLRVFSERARRAVLDPDCANLPLPAAMLGQVRTFTFRFRP